MSLTHPSAGWIAVVLILAGLESAHATSFVRWENRREAAKTFRLVPEIQFLSSSANYAQDGESVAIDGLDYSKKLYDFNLIYGIGPRASAFARISVVGVSYTATGLTASGFGLGDQALGFNYRLYQSKGGEAVEGAPRRQTSVDGQLQFDIPFYDNAAARRSNPKKPLLGDGTFDITMGPFVTLPLSQGKGSRHFLIGSLGVKIRNKGFSTAVPYQVYWTSVPERSGFVTRLGLAGLKSMSSDSSTTIALDSGAIVQDAGGSLIVDAQNSSYLALKSGLGYQFNPTNQLYLGVEKSLSGTSTANLFAFSLGAQFRFGGSSRKTSEQPARAKPARRYDLDAIVTATNSRMNLLRINRGANDGLARGQVIDIFTDAQGNDIIARGVVTSTRPDDSVIQIKQYVKQVVIQSGFTAKRLVR